MIFNAESLTLEVQFRGQPLNDANTKIVLDALKSMPDIFRDAYSNAPDEYTAGRGKKSKKGRYADKLNTALDNVISILEERAGTEDMIYDLQLMKYADTKEGVLRKFKTVMKAKLIEAGMKADKVNKLSKTIEAVFIQACNDAPLMQSVEVAGIEELGLKDIGTKGIDLAIQAEYNKIGGKK